MSITPRSPATVEGERVEHGSVLGGKTRAAWVSSQWKSTDIYDYALEDLSWTPPYLVMAVLMSAAAAWIAVRWSLHLLRVIAAQAARIDMDSLHR
ncbi:hypothetical protein [Methylosinus sp. LW3]|uniref:hypothetical protein n=1 Tax=Methylosinus sp. LW3 TaxID=107635 RepID=UPI0006880D0C|nr:hypothetical protein [Methylosinus sp. LW3]